jgi:hypothetical protein
VQHLDFPVGGEWLNLFTGHWEMKVLYKRWRKLSFEDEPALY